MQAGEATPLFRSPFEISTPRQQQLPVVFNSPHSGSIYPEIFLRQSRLDPLTLRRSEDSYVDELFACAADLGCPLLAANFPRAYLDVNREPWELDQQMFLDTLPEYVNSGSIRVAGGLGTIPRIVSEHHEIYGELLTWPDAERRIAELYVPYHAALQHLLDRTRQDFGWALLVDCHSMPSTAAASCRSPGGSSPQIILGDRFGSTCDEHFISRLEEIFTGHGLSVLRNRLYAGGHITQTYGEPHAGINALQVEINRALYMNERTLERTAGFASLRRLLHAVFSEFLATLPGYLDTPRVAAE